MHSFHPYDIPIRERHQYIIGAVSPRPICWASTMSKEGVPNLAPYSFFNAFSANPPVLVFSSNRRGRDNTIKDTLVNIQETKEVVIHVVTEDLVNQMNISSTDYPSETNEFEKAGVTAIPSDIVKPYRVQESPVHFECKVNKIIALGSDGGAGNLFICEIVKMHIDERILDDQQKVDPMLLKPVGRLGGNWYTRVNQQSLFEIQNPFDKINIGFDGLPDHIKRSNILTGNEIALMAMETSLPSITEIDQFRLAHSELAEGNYAEKEIQAKSWISEGAVRKALIALLS